MNLLVAGATDVGLVREHNEDNFAVIRRAHGARQEVTELQTLEMDEAGVLLVVCDGMGGAAAGEIASAMAVEALASPASSIEGPVVATPDGLSDPGLCSFARGLRAAAYLANRQIFQAQQADPNRAGMGTTMTAVGVLPDRLVMAQVGDSRAYLLRQGLLVQVTRDQSLVNQLIELGQLTEAQARDFEQSNVILQALGVQEEVEVQLSTVALCEGDRVVVCSDGLTGVLTDEEIAHSLGHAPDVASACRDLIELAKSGGAPDNVTVIAAQFTGGTLRAASPEGRVVYERWWLDEERLPPASPTQFEVTAKSPSIPEQSTVGRVELLFSAMVMLIVALAGIVIATALYRHAPRVECTILSPEGHPIHLNGRDTGVRTQSGGRTTVTLPPGRQRIGRGDADDEQWIEVAATKACVIQFAEAGP